MNLEELGYFLYMEKQEKKNDRDEKKQQEQLQKVNVGAAAHLQREQPTTQEKIKTNQGNSQNPPPCIDFRP